MEPALKPLGLPKNLPPITRKEMARLLKLPTRTFAALHHVGELQDPTSVNGDHEGPLLSVSLHPNAWSQIARLGEDTWSLVAQGKFLLINRLAQKKSQDAHLQWGLKHGLVTQATWWSAPIPANEDGGIGYILCQTKEEAEEEQDPEIGGKIRRKSVLVASEPLTTFWRQRIPQDALVDLCPSMTEDMLLTLLIEIASHQNWEEFPDGLWWNENYDPHNYSAPRGGLSPTRLIKNPRVHLSLSHCPKDED